MTSPARRYATAVVLYGGLTTWVVLATLPILWAAVISLRRYVDAFSSPLKLLAPVTLENYYGLWIEREFYENFLNSIVVTLGTVSISLSVGCLAGYALSRYRGNIGFWLMIVALVFRAIPHSTLLPSFYLIFDALGVRNTMLTLIFVLVAINQPFTIWMLRSFFMSIPNELDEAALVDGCTRSQAFVKVIIPVMWPGILTTGLFSFLLAYNDYLLTSALSNVDMMTMPVAIGSSINADSERLLMQGVAGAVSISVPLLLLIAFFQRQIVAGLTQGAVKG